MGITILCLVVVTATAASGGSTFQKMFQPADTGVCSWVPAWSVFFQPLGSNEYFEERLSMRVYPPDPTSADSIAVSIYGHFSSSSHSFEGPVTTVTTGEVNIDLNPVVGDGPAPQAVVPWILTVCIPPQAAGSMRVNLNYTEQLETTVMVEEWQDSEGPVALGWFGVGGSTRATAGLAYPGAVYLVVLESTAELPGESTAYRLDYDLSAVELLPETAEFAIGCEGQIVMAEPGTADVAVSCTGQGSAPQLATIQLRVLPGFAGNSDVRLVDLTPDGDEVVSSRIRLRASASSGVVPTDFNFDGEVALFDLFFFADAYAQGFPRADLDGNGRVEWPDIFRFVDTLERPFFGFPPSPFSL